VAAHLRVQPPIVINVAYERFQFAHRRDPASEGAGPLPPAQRANLHASRGSARHLYFDLHGAPAYASVHVRLASVLVHRPVDLARVAQLAEPSDDPPDEVGLSLRHAMIPTRATGGFVHFYS
jgi:hypothetical protein